MGLGKMILLSGNSGGAPAFTPLDNPGVKYWFNGFDQTTFAVTGGKVTSWFDSGPNSYTANAISGGPTYNGSYRNGKAAAIFASDTALFFGNTAQIQAGESFHIFMLTNSADAAPNFSRLLNLATNGISGVNDYGCVFLWAADTSYQNFSMGVTGGDLAIRGPNVPLNQDILLEVSWDGILPFGIAGAMTIAYNGTNDTVESNPGIIPEPQTNIMGYNADAGSGFTGPIGALYQCDQLTDLALERTRAYFLDGWALS